MVPRPLPSSAGKAARQASGNRQGIWQLVVDSAGGITTATIVLVTHYCGTAG